MKKFNIINKPQEYFKYAKLCLIIIFTWCMMSMNTFAQLYTRTTFNSSYIPITTGTGATVSTATGDNVNQISVPLGFTLNYAGISYSQIGFNTNGVLWFDAVAPSATEGSFNSRLYATGGTNQTIAPWWIDAADDASSEILYQTQGTPGSQTFTVQYTNYPHYKGVAGTNIRLNFQVIFYEGTNIIEFHYGPKTVTGPPTNAGGACIGIEYGTGGPLNYIDMVTGSNSTSHGMMSPLVAWPSYNYRMTPGAPAPVAAGTYNVGIGQTYPSLTLATSDINHRGISGPVTLNLTDANYDTTAANGSNIFPIFVGPVAGTSAVNTLTISKTGAPATLSYKGSPVVQGSFGFGSTGGLSGISDSEEPILGVCSRYTTISNINLVSLGTTANDVEVGLMVFEAFGGTMGAWYNVFDKISVNMDRTNPNTVAINLQSLTSPGGAQGTNSFNTFRDITIRDSYAGIILTGVTSATGQVDVGNQIITSSCNTYNSIGDPNVPGDLGGNTSNAYGIKLHGQQNFVVKNNIVSNITCTSSIADVNGIYISSVNGICELNNNIVSKITRINATSQNPAVGIRLTSSGNQIKELRAFNNSVSDIKTTYSGLPTASITAIGISIEGSGNSGKQKMYIWNNSVSIDGASFLNASNTCFEISNAANVEHIVKNNVFANFTPAQTGVARHYAIVSSLADRIGYSLISSCDYNDFYVANDLGTSGHVGLGATTNYSTLAAWQAAMTFQPGTDANSISSDPFFINNNNDLHATAFSVALNGAATTPPAYVNTDIDCQARTAPHDLGSDDFGVCTPIGGTVSPAIANICEGVTYNMSSTGFSTEPGTTYQWQVSGTSGGPYTNVTGGSGANTPSYTTDPLSAGTYYFVMKTLCSGPGTDTSTELQLVVNVAPSAAAAGSDQGVVSATATLAGNIPAVGAGLWTVIAGTGSFVDDTDPGTVVNGLSAGINTFRWTISSAFCNSNSDDVDVIFSNCINPTATISGSTEICAGGSVNLTLNFTGLAPWTYSVNGAPAVTTSNNPETIIVIPGSTTTYNITSFSDALCTGLFSGSAIVTVKTAPPASSCTINSIPLTGCVGNVIVVTTTNVTGASSYTWSVPAGSLINGVPGPVSTSVNTANITLGPIGSGNSGWEICAFASNACGQTNTNCKWIRGILSTPATISGSAIACPNTGGVNNYSTSPVTGADSYVWTITGDALVSGTGTSASVSFGPSFTTGNLCVRAVLACGYQSAQRCMSISNATPLLSAMSGTFTVCPGTNGVGYSVSPSAGAASYIWTLPSGASIASGNNTNSITVDFGGGFSNGNICVTAVSVCGTNSLQRCRTISTITPGVPGNIVGSATGVCGQTITYSIPNVSGATSYSWIAPAGTSLGSPNGSNTISIVYPSNFTTGSLCVTANNACGSGNARCITVKGVSANPGVISGPSTVCAFDVADNYSVSPVFGATGYTWFTPAGTTIVSGQGTNSIIVDWGTSGGVMGVTANGPCGNSGTRTLNVIMNCKLSGEEMHGTEISAYPNPVSNILNLTMSTRFSGNFTVELIDITGRVVSSSLWKSKDGMNNTTLDVSGFAKGVYQLNIIDTYGVSKHIRILVQ